MKAFVLRFMPVFVQNCAITLYNTLLYRRRHKGVYRYYRRYFAEHELKPAAELAEESERRLAEFLQHSTTASRWYSHAAGKGLSEFPVLRKQQLVDHLDQIRTISEKDGIVSYTGGTTGASLKVIYTEEDMQERFAVLDHFRAQYGYELGRKTAWFSGKSLVRKRDLERGNCFRDDYLNKVRFFSTFHISSANFDQYWKALVAFAPEFVVGFPSSVYDLCVMAQNHGLRMQPGVKVFFPTAETLLREQLAVIADVLGCKIVNQYASSEGAPFILECTEGQLHIHPLTGVFEVVNEEMDPVEEGEILVTSFSTRGTPLVRYRIGDRVRLGRGRCKCGSAFPLVEYIQGRSADFIWSPTNGRVNLGNISNCTKDVRGILCFQVAQDEADSISVKVVQTSAFDEAERAKFVRALQERVGDKVHIEVVPVEHIARETSGKFRLVKNSLRPEDMVTIGPESIAIEPRK